MSPTVVTGKQDSSAVFTYKNVGTTTEHITVQAVELKPVTVHGKHGWSPYGEAGYATATPRYDTLKPGQHEVITVKMNSTDGKAHHVAVMVTASGQSQASGGRISASVAARYDVQPSPPSTLPWVPIGAGIAVLMALLAVWAVILRKRRRLA